MPQRLDVGAARAALERSRQVPEQTADRVSAADGDQLAAAGLREFRLKLWRQRVPRMFWDARADDFTGWPGHQDLVEWAAADHPTNMVMLGPVGVGKTHAATAAVRQHFGGGASLEWVPVGEMLDRLDWRRQDSHLYLEHLMTVDLLLVDDLGTERANEWTGERLYSIVNRRWLDQRPVVATTNLEPADLAEVLGERTYSRLVGGALMLRIAGADRRM